MKREEEEALKEMRRCERGGGEVLRKEMKGGEEESVGDVCTVPYLTSPHLSLTPVD